MSTLDTNELLTLLRQCAHKLLLAYDSTLHPDFWEAYEKTAQACETLYFKTNTPSPITLH